jgi:hypothetical protein
MVKCEKVQLKCCSLGGAVQPDRQVSSDDTLSKYHPTTKVYLIPFGASSSLTLLGTFEHPHEAEGVKPMVT